MMMLRIQLERMEGGFFPSLREYFLVFGMTEARLARAKPDVIVMHPGPINRGVEIASEVADGPYSVILDQVANGVAARMAVLYLLAGGGAEMKRLLKGARVVDPANGLDGAFDVLIDGGVIARVGRDLPASLADGGEVVALLAGLRRLPRVHRHARAPARARAGAQGDGGHRRRVGGGRRLHRRGLHAQHPPGQRQRRRHRPDPASKAADAGLARVYPIGAVSRGQLGEQLADIAELKHAGCVAISDDGHPVSTALLARRAMEYAGMFGMPLIEHCEDPSLKGEGVAHEGPVAASLGLKGIPGIAEAITAGRDILIAEMVGGHVHVAHMSAWTTLEAVRQGKSRGVQVTCEVAPHHFTLTDELLAAPIPYDTDTKMNPPLREARDRDAMLQPASPTAASTSSPPITRRTTPTRRTSSSTARRSASSASRRRFRSRSIGWCTAA